MLETVVVLLGKPTTTKAVSPATRVTVSVVEVAAVVTFLQALCPAVESNEIAARAGSAQSSAKSASAEIEIVFIARRNSSRPKPVRCWTETSKGYRRRFLRLPAPRFHRRKRCRHSRQDSRSEERRVGKEC